jgi:hypothetical protein
LAVVSGALTAAAVPLKLTTLLSVFLRHVCVFAVAWDQALDKTAGQIETNLGKITSANSQLAESLKASSGSCWTTLFMLLAVFLLFVATFMLIQVKGKVTTT